MKVSFCVTSMNRLDYIKKTLNKNIEDNCDSNLEVVLLDYNSSDGLEEWVKSNVMEYIHSGLLIYVRESNALSFLPSHSRNVCALCATGDIICNIDADNFVGKGFAKWLSENVMLNQVGISHYVEEYGEKGAKKNTSGRVAIWKDKFLRLGGYDESFIYGYGFEDCDLVFRAKESLDTVQIEERFLNSIYHSNEIRMENISFDKLYETDFYKENKHLSVINLSSCYHAVLRDERNGGAVNIWGWGNAELEVNFKGLQRVGRRGVACIH